MLGSIGKSGGRIGESESGFRDGCVQEEGKVEDTGTDADGRMGKALMRAREQLMSERKWCVVQ